jgi:hypothetical protein
MQGICGGAKRWTAIHATCIRRSGLLASGSLHQVHNAKNDGPRSFELESFGFLNSAPAAQYPDVRTFGKEIWVTLQWKLRDVK